MHLGLPLASFAPPVTSRVLEVLAGTSRPMTAADVHRVARAGTGPGVWKALERLAGQGLVTAQTFGRTTVYEANRQHVAWAAIEQLTELRDTLRTWMADALVDWEVEPIHASVFGSFARGEADDSSDVDVLFVHPDGLDLETTERWDDQLGRFRSDVRAWTGNDCQTVAVTPSRLLAHVDAGDPIVAAWIAEGRLLHGQDLRQLLSRLR